eukprot:2982340-Amphidinium_carterae.1
MVDGLLSLGEELRREENEYMSGNVGVCWHSVSLLTVMQWAFGYFGPVFGVYHQCTKYDFASNSNRSDEMSDQDMSTIEELLKTIKIESIKDR